MSDASTTMKKRQHFVPQFYLRKFLNPQNVVERLDCHERSIVAPSGTPGICYEKFYYPVTTGQPDDVSQEIENGFEEWETIIGQNFDPIISKLFRNEHVATEMQY